MTTEPESSEVSDLKARITILTENACALVDEKAKLEGANRRLGAELKAVIAEKEALRLQLASLQGMGVQRNDPLVFDELKKRRTTLEVDP